MRAIIIFLSKNSATLRFAILCYAMLRYGLTSWYFEAIKPESVQEGSRNDILHKASKQAQRNSVFPLKC